MVAMKGPGMVEMHWQVPKLAEESGNTCSITIHACMYFDLAPRYLTFVPFKFIRGLGS